MAHHGEHWTDSLEADPPARAVFDPVGDLWLAPATTFVPGPAGATGYAHPKCYARDLQDCSTKISNEHYFSRDLLLTIGETFTAEGLPFLDGPRAMSPKSLAAKILCTRHNSMLSPLDTTASKLFRTLRAVDANLRDAVRAPKAAAVVVVGADIERWMLKLCAGAVSGGALPADGLSPNVNWLQVLFRNQPFPAGTGLLVDTSGEQREAIHGAELIPFTNKETRLVHGIQLRLANVGFLLALGEFRGSAVYRPRGLRFGRPNMLAEETTGVALAWPGRDQGGWVNFVRLRDRGA